MSLLELTQIPTVIQQKRTAKRHDPKQECVGQKLWAWSHDDQHQTQAATSELEHDADIAQFQEWLGHANISTTKVYDRRAAKPRQSPTFKVSY